jgi:DNA (cytosine-5)-methyltransferase 1
MGRANINAADLFCGAGGSSTGLVRAAAMARTPIDLLAVNHWQVAVATHKRNHPWARHECADLSAVDPNKLVPSGKLNILIASPECTHHSIARGGKPCSDQSRASAWHVLHWAERLSPDEILIENVREFEQWGPLLENNRPDPKRKGVTFSAFKAALASLGYTVDHRILNAADYGDATCRRRLFLRATRSGQIRWPEASHSENPGSLGAKRWRAARDVIDWDLKGQSIMTRKKPLAPKTLKRIEAGLRKFGGKPFIAVLRGTSEVQLTCSPHSVDEPLNTISAGGGHSALCEPFIMNVAHTGGDESRCRSVGSPLSTIPAGHRGELALCEPFVIGQQSCASPRSVGDPLPTIATKGAIGLCQPFITKYYGSGIGARPVDEPLDTITARDRFALVEPGRMDILFRMLQPHELAAAMGFDDYVFEGTKTDQVRQIGNAVAVRTAMALCVGMLANVMGRR